MTWGKSKQQLGSNNSGRNRVSLFQQTFSDDNPAAPGLETVQIVLLALQVPRAASEGHKPK